MSGDRPRPGGTRPPGYPTPLADSAFPREGRVVADSAPVGQGMAREPFGQRLTAAMESHGPLCVGIDPHPGLLEAWGLRDDPSGLHEFALRVVEVLGGRVAALKPQSALFERHGSAGIAVLEEVLAACREAGTLSLLDVKRGDIGSTMAGYAQAYLADGAPLAADAVTLSPYLGLGSLTPAFELAHATGRGVFVLALTSNPEGAEVQHATGPGGRAVAAGIVDGVTRLNTVGGADAPGGPVIADDVGRRHAAGTAGTPDASEVVDGLNRHQVVGPARGRLGSVGIVVGATTGPAVRELGIDLAACRAPLLAPGFGAQGAGRAEVAEVFAGAEHAVLASTSRAVLAAGPEGLARAAAQATAEVRGALAR